ncbi:MAG TPA: response regulator [Gammaproteobacteria bacterium]|nr:response regulator [Gammaproteobacteria bacterium]
MNDSDNRQVILVVDDEPMNITLLAGILKGHYKVKMAKDGEKALRIAAATPPPDLILLDVMMPGMDGWEVCRRLKAQDTTRDIPLVFVTGMTDDSERRKGLALGAAGFLHKPVDAAEVLETVRSLLESP